MSPGRSRRLEKNSKILYLHSNTTPQTKALHISRVQLYNSLGYDVRLFDSTQYFSSANFPRLDRDWKRRDARLMAFYEILSRELEWCDAFIHYNGANIHPRYLEQFGCLKIYHCADDPDASAVISRPVALTYDVCAISNVACLDMYRGWGCKNVIFWPLGATFADDIIQNAYSDATNRDISLVFVGSKYGASSMRYFGKLFGLYKRRRFMEGIEKKIPSLVAYGHNWRRGAIADAELPVLYARSCLGLNKHNSLGPVNFRLFDLPAFGVMQICDNRDHLDRVFRLNHEVVGYESLRECMQLIEYYLQNPDDARTIAAAGKRRFDREYSAIPLWKNFVKNVNDCLEGSVSGMEGAQAPVYSR